MSWGCGVSESRGLRMVAYCATVRPRDLATDSQQFAHGHEIVPPRAEAGDDRRNGLAGRLAPVIPRVEQDDRAGTAAGEDEVDDAVGVVVDVRVGLGFNVPGDVDPIVPR